jgi:restriction system protein
MAVIGWDDLPDLARIASREALEALLEQTYADEKRNTLRNWTNQIWSFIAGIQVGDLITLPLKTRPTVAMGEVTGPYQYRPDLPPGSRHTRPVRWEKELPRSALDQDLLYSLGAFMTVGRIQRNEAEIRIRALVSGQMALGAPLANTHETAGGEAPTDLEPYAQDQIRNFIGRKFKGHGLTQLVATVLETQGYQVKVSPPGADGGVDIIAGYGPMGFDHPRLVAQVKSGEDPVDVKVLRELQGVMRNFGADHGLIVAWGGYRQSVPKEADRHFFDIRLWDADDLIRMILGHYERLPDGLQAELPLKRIWTLVWEEE